MHLPADKHGERLQFGAGYIIVSVKTYFPARGKVEVAVPVKTGIGARFKSAVIRTELS